MNLQNPGSIWIVLGKLRRRLRRSKPTSVGLGEGCDEANPLQLGLEKPATAPRLQQGGKWCRGSNSTIPIIAQKIRLRQAQPALLLRLLPEREAVKGPLPEHAVVEGNRILLMAGIPIDWGFPGSWCCSLNRAVLLRDGLSCTSAQFVRPTRHLSVRAILPKTKQYTAHHR